MFVGIPHLKQCFQELHELIKILLDSSLTQLIENPKQRTALYPKLDMSKLVVLLEKLAPTPIGMNPLNVPRLDAKTIKALIKKAKLLLQT